MNICKSLHFAFVDVNSMFNRWINMMLITKPVLIASLKRKTLKKKYGIQVYNNLAKVLSQM